MAGYGIDINTLDTFIAQPVPEKREWGEYVLLVSEPVFRFERIDLLPGKETSFGGTDDFESTIWIETGEAKVEEIALTAQESITVPAHKKWRISTESKTAVFIFSGPADSVGGYLEKRTSFDFRDKYWGSIESIVSKAYAGKRMVVRKGKYASLEYHCNKTEAYYIHSGKLLLRLRAGRAEDKFFPLDAGTVSFTPPGLMHQRGGLEDTVIIEISTKDEDSDSFLVEDGQKTPMPRINDNL